ncbi:MAG: hypothetical protein Q9210_004402 [Variospora velana]
MPHYVDIVEAPSLSPKLFLQISRITIVPVLPKFIQTTEKTMAKALEQAIAALRAISNAASKFSAAAQDGHRIIPSKVKDASIPVRIDAGKYNATSKKLPVILQVNSQARTGLGDWRKKQKNTSHAKLATEEFDTAAADPDAEYKRVLDSLMTKGKEELKK